MARRRRRALPVLAILFVVMQLFPARIKERELDPAYFIESSLQVSGEIGALLRRSCYDCHGGPTRMPWYGRVAPSSWLVAYDVNESMEKLDFSRWGRLDARRQIQLLGEMSEEVRKGEMPLDRYLWLHNEARLTPAEKDKFARWAEGEATRLESSPIGGRPEEGASSKSSETEDDEE